MSQHHHFNNMYTEWYRNGKHVGIICLTWSLKLTLQLTTLTYL